MGDTTFQPNDTDTYKTRASSRLVIGSSSSTGLNMFTKTLFLALVIHTALGAPSQGEPVLDALAAHHNIAVQDHSYTAVIPQVLGKEVVLQNNPIHFKTGYFGTPIHPVSTGQVIGEHVETFALGKQRAHAQVVKQVAIPQIKTQMMTQSVQVPVQTMQTVQVPSVQYQTVQVPVQIKKEIVQVEKPVPVPQPIPVEAPPKPYVKEAIYARPFQMTQKYVKTRITPLKEIKTAPTQEQHTTTTLAPDTTTERYEPQPMQTLVDFTEEKLYYASRKRKVVTRFIKIEEYYEAETNEEVGVSYSYGNMDGDNFDLRITRIFEADQPILVKNLTTTTKVSTYRSPVHIVQEYINDKLVRTFHAGESSSSFQGNNASESHFGGFHSELINNALIPSKFGDQLKVSKHTEFMHGKQVEIEERVYTLPEGHALFTEKRIRPVGDFSAFPENIEPVPSFEVMYQNGKRVLVLTLTYDSTKSLVHGKHGVAVSESFGSDFTAFMNEFKKYINSDSLMSHRHKRSIESVTESTSVMKKNEMVSSAVMSNSTKTVENIRKKRVPQNQIQFHGKTYAFVKSLAKKGYTPGGFLYRSDDGSEIKVEEEVVSQKEGSPRNEYLRFSQVYVPKQKVKYEVSGLFGQPIESSWLRNHYNGFQSYPLPHPFYNLNGFSYKYGGSGLSESLHLL